MNQGAPGVLSFPKDIICGNSWDYHGPPCPNGQVVFYSGNFATNFSKCFSCDNGQYTEGDNFGFPTRCEPGYFVCAKSLYNIYTRSSLRYGRTQIYTPFKCCRIGQLCTGGRSTGSDCLDLPPSSLNMTDPTFDSVTSSKAVASTTALIGGIKRSDLV
jgi:hypothetical protein